MRLAVITASDKGFCGEREDISGKLVSEIAEKFGFKTVYYEILPDDRQKLADSMKKICDNKTADLILTTGGTGFSMRDVTPEATKDVITREVPGISEAMRFNSLKITKRAMLSRGIAGICNKTLIINLPGSPKAVSENLEFIIEELVHGIEILKGDADECGTNKKM